MSTLTHGARIGHTGIRAASTHPNWPSFSLHQEAAEKAISRDIANGAKAGPFSEPPFREFVGSPMGAFLKRHSSKVRVIHDLSFPPDLSVNDFIPSEDCAVQYGSVDAFIDKLRSLGRGALMAKLDLENAYRQVLVHPDDWDLLGSTIIRNGVTEYYVDMTLPFGLRSAPLAFNEVADALAFYMCTKGATYIDHYLDDYFTLGPPASPECQSNMDCMLSACHDTAFPVSSSPGKVVHATTCMELLGLIIDTEAGELRISEERLRDTMAELETFLGIRKCKKRALLSLVGKLIFISRVVRSGRTFTRRLIEAAKGIRHLHHRVSLSAACREDIRWWATYLPSWNGVAIFTDPDWTHAPDMRLATDASDIGIGISFRDQWVMCDLATAPWDRAAKQDIAWRELLAVVIAIATFGPELAGRRVLFDCDNQAIVSAVNTGTIRNPDIMCLVRTLFYYMAHFSIEAKAVYITSEDNVAADALSRLDLPRFAMACPDASPSPTPPTNVMPIVYQCGLEP